MKIINFVTSYTSSVRNATIIRCLISVFALINILSVLPDIVNIYSKYGFINNVLSKEVTPSYKITIDDFTNLVYSITSIDYIYSFYFLFMCYILGLLMIIFNFHKLYFSIIALFLQTIFVNSSPLMTYGADYMITFSLFLNVLLCLEGYLSKSNFELVFSFSIRLAQIQLCVIYFFGGFAKALGLDWITGDAIWLSLNIYIENQKLLDFIGYNTSIYVYQVLSISVVLLELLYPIGVSVKKFRKKTVLSIIIMHISIGFIIGLYTFSTIMIILNIIAFYTDSLDVWVSKIKNIKNSVFNKKHLLD